jgi:hypothetical protein
MEGQLNTTATAPTPKADNTKSTTPSAGGFFKMNAIVLLSYCWTVLDDLGKSDKNGRTADACLLRQKHQGLKY